MSVNIQTANGLIKISGDKVTKENIKNALGYTPADVEALPEITDDASDSLVIADAAGNIATQINGEGIKTIEDVVIQTTTNTYSTVDHIEDATRHVTAAERTKWNNKSDFSGSYADLTDQPNITEDDTGMIQVADNAGNIILQVDQNGVATHDVTVNNSTESVSTHHNNDVLHITDSERTKWNNKSDFSGSYADLTDAPNIQPEETDSSLVVADNDGNIIARVDQEGITTHDVSVNGSIESVSAHHNNTTSHITSTERTKWNNKSDFSGNYTDLVGEPDITEDESAELNIADSEGNIIATVSSEGVESHEFIVNGIGLGNEVSKHDTRIGTLEGYVVGDRTVHEDVVPLLDNVHTHVNDTNIHVQSGERAKWNSAKEIADEIHDDYATGTAHGELSATVSNHITDATDKLHITSAERVKWNNKSDFSGNYTDLTGEPDIHDDESDELNIADSSGNVIFRAAKDGVRAYEVTVGPENETADHPVYEVGSTLKTHADTIAANKDLFDTHIKDTSSNASHITQAERTKWNSAKTTADSINSDYATGTEHNELKATVEGHIGDTTHLQDGERTKWNSAKTIADAINADYATGTALDSYKDTVADTYETIANVNALSTTVDNHINDRTTKLHVTSAEKVAWNNKSNFSGNYTDLVGEPDIHDDETDELNIADSSGNVIMRVDREGIRAFSLTVGPENATAEREVYDVGTELKDLIAHTEDSNIHVTASEQSTWNSHVTNTTTHITSAERTKWNKAVTDLGALDTEVTTHIGDATHVTATEKLTWNGKTTLAAVESTYRPEFEDIYRKLVLIGDLREVSTSYVSGYTRQPDGSATVTIDAEMFDTFLIYDQGTYNVSVTYDEWGGTVSDHRILAEHTGPHTVRITRKDGSAVTTSELGILGSVVEHIKNGFSVYFNKLYRIILAQNNIDESSLTFDTTSVIEAE